MEDLLWESRILKERAQEHEEWKMMAEVQLSSKISRIQMTLKRQKLTNSQLKDHISALDQQIKELSSILEENS